MKYQGKTFSVAYGSKEYRDNYDRVFWRPRMCTRDTHEGCEFYGDDWNCMRVLDGIIPCKVAWEKSSQKDGGPDLAPRE